MLRSLDRRDLKPERMDQPDLEADRHRQALAGLARTNWLGGISGTLWRRIRRLPGVRKQGAELTLCDIGSGAGDVAVGLWRRANRDGVKLRVTGYDISPLAVETAESRAAAVGADARFEVRDILSSPPDEADGFDVVTCSLFLHHLAQEQAVDLLKRMARLARRLVVVSDLERGRAGYTVAQVVVRLVTRSDVVHYDGPQSVAAAFTVAEASELAARAGLAEAEVRRCWPFRYLLSWEPRDSKEP